MTKHFKKLVLLFAAALVLIVSCSKEDSNKTQETPSTPVLNDNVVIIDANKLQLDETPSNLDNGIYQFAFTGTAPNITLGDVIVGEQGDGFLRKVTAVSVNGNNIVLQTTQGSMSDVFKDGGFNFYLDMNDMQNRKSSGNGFTYTINNQPIYQQGALNIILDNGQVDLNSNWFFDFSFDKNGLDFFEVSSKNGTLNGNFTATVTASQAVTLLDKSSSILPGGKPYAKTYTKYVPAVLLGLPVVIPVKVKMELDLVLDYSASINAAITRQANFTSNNTFNLGLNYSNGKRNDINSFSPSNTFTLSKRTGNANATINLALTPKVSFKLYNVIGPYLHIGLNEQLSGNMASPSLDWDFKADVWLKTAVGINDISILGKNIEGYSKTWETSKLSYITPYKIEKVSGDNQTGDFGKQLTTPLKVRVLDNLDKVQSNVPVYFTVVEGGGKVITTSVLTDANGFAETQWTLGASGKQIVNVSSKKADGTVLLNAPVSFTAIVGQNVLVGNWTLTHFNGDQMGIWDSSNCPRYRTNSGNVTFTTNSFTLSVSSENQGSLGIQCGNLVQDIDTFSGNYLKDTPTNYLISDLLISRDSIKATYPNGVIKIIDQNHIEITLNYRIYEGAESYTDSVKLKFIRQ